MLKKTKNNFSETILWVSAIASVVILIVLWECAVRMLEIKPFLLPSPIPVAQVIWYRFICDIWMSVSGWVAGIFIQDAAPIAIHAQSLMPSFLATCYTAFGALFFAMIAGVSLAVLCTWIWWLRPLITPYMVIIKVTPMLVMAPYIIVYINNVQTQLILCALIIAFFPIFSNTMNGLDAYNRDLQKLFVLYNASSLQTVVLLRLPYAVPYFMSGLRISYTMALTGAVVAEFIIGSSGKSVGLASRIIESSYRLDLVLMFAATTILSLTGVIGYFIIGGIEWAWIHQRGRLIK